MTLATTSMSRIAHPRRRRLGGFAPGAAESAGIALAKLGGSDTANGDA